MNEYKPLGAKLLVKLKDPNTDLQQVDGVYVPPTENSLDLAEVVSVGLTDRSFIEGMNVLIEKGKAKSVTLDGVLLFLVDEKDVWLEVNKTSI